MDWQIKTPSRKSSLTGEAFQPGDRSVSIIFVDHEMGELGRADLHERELEKFELSGQVLGRWSRVTKDHDDASVRTSDSLASAEDFFFSLFENTQNQAIEESNMLKHLLALLLERKRVLRAVGPRQTVGVQRYRHIKTKQEWDVPIAEISRELMLKIEDTLGDIIL
ncbi:MAG: hypothetical protein ACPG3X_00690 [Opitutales bacterium]